MALSRQLGWFVAVGAAAAGVHLAVVVGLVDGGGWPPLRANVAGWAVAFGVSFLGHAWLTFGGHGVPWWRALRRFLPISAGGFVVNEAAYALLLGREQAHYALLLALVLVGVAVLTFVLSRWWAFRTGPGDAPDR